MGSPSFLNESPEWAVVICIFKKFLYDCVTWPGEHMTVIRNKRSYLLNLHWLPQFTAWGTPLPPFCSLVWSFGRRRRVNRMLRWGDRGYPGARGVTVSVGQPTQEFNGTKCWLPIYSRSILNSLPCVVTCPHLIKVIPREAENEQICKPLLLGFLKNSSQ